MSAVVPTCDRRQALPDCLRSILAQEVDLEVVVVDDGHTDAAQQVREELSDHRLRLVSSNRCGSAAKARNVGIRAARGEWIAFCDDDDLWAPNKLTRLLDALGHEGARWAYSAAVVVDAELNLIAHQPVSHVDHERLDAVNVIPGGGSNVIAHRSLVQETGWFDESLTNAEDWDYSVRLAETGVVAVVNEPLVAYRRWGASKSNNPAPMRRSISTIAAKAGDEGVERSRRYPRDRYLADQYFRSNGRLSAAGAYLGLALRHHRPADAVRVLGALAAPEAMARHDMHKNLERIPSDWFDETEAWLTAYRTPPAKET